MCAYVCVLHMYLYLVLSKMLFFYIYLFIWTEICVGSAVITPPYLWPNEDVVSDLY